MTWVTATAEFHQLDGHQAVSGRYPYISASAAAAARSVAGRAHAVQLPSWPSTARPPARTPPPYSRDRESRVLIKIVRVLVEPPGTLTRPSDDPPGHDAPSFQDRSSQTSSPPVPPVRVAHARPGSSI